nr:unnamed protein product [Callosobruchus chinensis]
MSGKVQVLQWNARSAVANKHSPNIF